MMAHFSCLPQSTLQKNISDFLKTLFKLRLRLGNTLKQSFSCIFPHMAETVPFIFFSMLDTYLVQFQ